MQYKNKLKTQKSSTTYLNKEYLSKSASTISSGRKTDHETTCSTTKNPVQNRSKPKTLNDNTKQLDDAMSMIFGLLLQKVRSMFICCWWQKRVEPRSQPDCYNINPRSYQVSLRCRWQLSKWLSWQPERLHLYKSQHQVDDLEGLIITEMIINHGRRR